MSDLVDQLRARLRARANDLLCSACLAQRWHDDLETLAASGYPAWRAEGLVHRAREAAHLASLVLDLREAADRLDAVEARERAMWQRVLGQHACVFEPICACGANARCKVCGQGYGAIPCACTPLPAWQV